jgi:hypothetical protein
VARGDPLDDLVDQITVDAHGDDGYWYFLQAFNDEASFPFDASVVGVAVSVIGIDVDGVERRGLVAAVRRDCATTSESLLDVEIPDTEPNAKLLAAAYRCWLGVH